MDASSEERMKKLVGRIENVPTLPTVMARILAATQDPKTSAEDVNKIILGDQALTAKILKLVNSAFYGFPRKIGTVTEAVVILGFATVRNLAITASVFQSFGSRKKGRFDRESFWRHSVAVGTVSRILARRMNMPSQEDIFVAGLLHDLGKVVLDHHCHEDFMKALDLAEENEWPLYKAEEEIFGVSHAEVGRWLAERWNMPDFLVFTIAHHHNPADVPEGFPVVSLVHIGNTVARYRNIGSGGDTYTPPIKTEALQRLNFKKEYLNSVLETLDDDLEKALQLLSIF